MIVTWHPIGTLGGALLFFAVSVIVPQLLRQALNEGVKSAIVWKPDSPTTTDERFRLNNATDEVPDHLQFWLLNITNVDGVRIGDKPRLEEIGPFTYRKVKVKVDVWWGIDGTVATKEYNYHELVPELTVGSLDAPITTLNMALIGVLEAVHAAMPGPAYEKLVDIVISIIASWRDDHVNGLFHRRTVQELLWGYEDPLLKRLAAILPHGTIPSTWVELVHNMSSVDEALAALPVVFDSGKDNISSVWQVLSDAGVIEATCWNNCTEPVRGTDGTQFAPGVQRSQPLQVWVSNLHRATSLVYKADVELSGIHLLRFQQDPQDSAPDECHYQRVRGLMNITIPQAVGASGRQGQAVGPPIYVSPPHFCACDPSLAAAVEGMHCDPEVHMTFVDVEPITGITMRGRARAMISSEITPGARKHLEPKLNRATNGTTVIPIFWMDEYCYASDKAAESFKSSVYGVLNVISVVKLGSLVIASFLLLLSATLLVRCAQQHKADHAAGGRRTAGRGDRAPASPAVVVVVDEEEEDATRAPLLGPSG